MSDKCYVIYAIHRDMEDERIVGVTTMACVSTVEKARECLQAEVDEYTAKGVDAEWFNEGCIRIVDEELPFIHYITYQEAINYLEGGN